MTGPTLTVAGLKLCLALVRASNPTFEECEERLAQLVESTKGRPYAAIVYTDLLPMLPPSMTCIHYGQVYELATMFCYNDKGWTFDYELGAFRRTK